MVPAVQAALDVGESDVALIFVRDAPDPLNTVDERTPVLGLKVNLDSVENTGEAANPVPHNILPVILVVLSLVTSIACEVVADAAVPAKDAVPVTLTPSNKWLLAEALFIATAVVPRYIVWLVAALFVCNVFTVSALAGTVAPPVVRSLTTLAMVV